MFCLGFCSIVWFFAPEIWPENFSSRQVCCFLVFVLSLSLSLSLFFRHRRLFVFVVFKRESSGLTGHTPPRTVLVLFFFPFCPRRTWFLARFGRASFLSRFLSGCHSGPRAFFGFSWNLRGLSSLAPSEALFGREAARVFGFLLVCVVSLFAAFTH